MNDDNEILRDMCEVQPAPMKIGPDEFYPFTVMSALWEKLN